MVIWSAFRMKKYRVNDHPYHALQFTLIRRSWNSEFYLRVVLCRIRLFPTLISKIKWSELSLNENDPWKKVMSEDKVEKQNPPKYELLEDLANMTYLSEASVVYNLSERYVKFLIYTYSGMIFIENDHAMRRRLVIRNSKILGKNFNLSFENLLQVSSVLLLIHINGFQYMTTMSLVVTRAKENLKCLLTFIPFLIMLTTICCENDTINLCWLLVSLAEYFFIQPWNDLEITLKWPWNDF